MPILQGVKGVPSAAQNVKRPVYNGPRVVKFIAAIRKLF